MAGLKKVGVPTRFFLNIRMVTELGEVRVAPDFLPSLAVRKEGSEVVLDSPQVHYEGAVGDYSSVWPPNEVGTFILTWTFIVDGDAYTDQEVVIAVEIQNAEEVEESPHPDIGVHNTCELTAKFISAGGKNKKGIFVRFTPNEGTSVASGFLVSEVTAESDEDGLISMHVVRGAEGLLTITGVGLVRRVVIPDQDTIDIFDLTATSQDLLEVKKIKLIEIPRRS